MHCLLTDDHGEAYLLDELKRAYPTGKHEQIAPRWVRSDAPLDMPLAFCRQAMPDATEVTAVSINAWATLLLEATMTALPQDQPWQLQIVACYGQAHEGVSRCQFIRKAVHERLQKKRRALLRTLQGDPLGSTRDPRVAVGGPLMAASLREVNAAEFASSPYLFQRAAETDTRAARAPLAALVQLYLTAPDQGFLSVVSPGQHQQWHRNAWPFEKGELPIASDKTAPSRAFAKLVESEQRLGQRIENGQTVVDLGACPGSWSYVAVQRGAKVISVDRSPLRDDLMQHPRITFVQGDAFKYIPPQPVDWLICDIIAAPDRSIELLLDWVKAKRCRRFIVSIKFKGSEEYEKIDLLKAELPALCSDFYLARLCANKNEVCAFGVV